MRQVSSTMTFKASAHRPIVKIFCHLKAYFWVEILIRLLLILQDFNVFLHKETSLFLHLILCLRFNKKNFRKKRNLKKDREILRNKLRVLKKIASRTWSIIFSLILITGRSQKRPLKHALIHSIKMTQENKSFCICSITRSMLSMLEGEEDMWIERIYSACLRLMNF